MWVFFLWTEVVIVSPVLFLEGDLDGDFEGSRVSGKKG